MAALGLEPPSLISLLWKTSSCTCGGKNFSDVVRMISDDAGDVVPEVLSVVAVVSVANKCSGCGELDGEAEVSPEKGASLRFLLEEAVMK